MRYPKSFICSLCLAILVLSCGHYQVESDETTPETPTEETTRYTLSIHIESRDNAQINLPLSVFIFNQANECVHTESLTQTEDDYQTLLPKGKYNIVVWSAMEGNGLSYPLQFTPQSYVSMPNGLHAPTPPQSGKVSINLTQATTAHLTLSYLVAALRFSLNGIPSQAEAVEVKVSPVSSAVTFEGDYKNDLRETVIACHKEGLRWTSQDAYVFPCTTATQTRLTISVSLPDRNEAYGYTYPSMLKPGTPYHFSGKYADAITLDGHFESKGWQQVTEIEFGFDEIKTDPSSPAPEPSTPGEENKDNESTRISVKELPEAGSIWKECLVCHVKKLSPTSCEAVIIANDYMLLTAANLEAYLNDFQFNELSGWRTFTTEEASSFRDTYYGTNAISSLNSFLLQNDVSPFKHETGDRYFCNNGKSSFCFTSQTIAATGEKKTYYIRPVKSVIFSTE